jgi:hypothetical protein
MFCQIIDRFMEILLLIEQALLIYIHRNRAVKIILRSAVIDGKTVITREGEIMNLSDIQKATFEIDPGDIVDVKGNPAPVDGELAWESSDPALATVNVSNGGLTCEVVAVGPLGHVQLKVTGDADLGAGIVPIIGLKEIDIVSSQAVAINIGDVTPVDQ